MEKVSTDILTITLEYDNNCAAFDENTSQMLYKAFKYCDIKHGN